MQPGLIETYLQQGKLDEAISACNEALMEQPTNARFHAYLGMCHFRKAEFEPAAQSFQRATALDPNFCDAAVKLAQCYDRLRKYEESYSIAKEWLQIYPNNRVLQGLVDALQHRVKGNRQDGWERSAHMAHAVVWAADESA